MRNAAVYRRPVTASLQTERCRIGDETVEWCGKWGAVDKHCCTLSFSPHATCSPPDLLKESRTLVIAPQVDTATGPPQRRSGTWRAPSSIAHTCLIPSQPKPVLIYRPREDGGLSKPGPGCKEQLAHGCYATARSQRNSNPRPRGRWSSTLTTRLSRHPHTNDTQHSNTRVLLCCVSFVCVYTTNRHQTTTTQQNYFRRSQLSFPSISRLHKLITNTSFGSCLTGLFFCCYPRLGLFYQFYSTLDQVPTENF